MTLQQYIFKQLLVAFVFAVGGMLFIALPGIAVAAVHRLAGVETAAIAMFVPKLLLSLVPYILPLGYLLATVATFGRLAADNEWTAIRMAGFQPLWLVLPPMLLAILCSVGTTWLMTTKLPEDQKKEKQYQITALQRTITNLSPGRTELHLGRFRLKAAERRGNEFRRVFIHIPDRRGGPSLSLLAASLSIDVTDGGNVLVIPMRDARIVHGDHDTQVENPTFEIDLSELIRPPKNRLGNLRYKTSSEIVELMDVEPDELRRTEMRFELHHRVAIATTFVMFCLLGRGDGPACCVAARSWPRCRSPSATRWSTTSPRSWSRRWPSPAQAAPGRRRLVGQRRRRPAGLGPAVEGAARMSAQAAKVAKVKVPRRRLRAGGHLDRYVAALFLGGYATAFLIVVGLFLILSMANELDDYLEPWPDGTRVPTLLVVRFYALSVPFVFLQLAPFVTLVAGMFTVTRLLRNNEAIAALAAGVSSHRLLAPVFLGGFLVAGGMFGMRELLSAPILNGDSIADKRDLLLFVLEERSFDRVYENVWLDGLDGSNVLLREFRPATGEPPVAEAHGLEAWINRSTELVAVAAERAVYVQRDEGGAGWWLEGGERRETLGAQRVSEVEWLEGFPFTPQLALSFERGRERPLELSFQEARELASRDPDSVIYRTLLQYHIVFPLANVILLLVGLPLLMRYERSRGPEGLAMGCLVCVFYFAADFVCRNLGLGGNLDPTLASWLPLLFFGSLGLVLFDSMRT